VEPEAKFQAPVPPPKSFWFWHPQPCVQRRSGNNSPNHDLASSPVQMLKAQLREFIDNSTDVTGAMAFLRRGGSAEGLLPMFLSKVRASTRSFAQ